MIVLALSLIVMAIIAWAFIAAARGGRRRGAGGRRSAAQPNDRHAGRDRRDRQRRLAPTLAARRRGDSVGGGQCLRRAMVLEDRH